MSLGGGHTVSCIACGSELSRSDAREYDKEGDRWDRRGKSFEYLCKQCYQDLSKADREGLETKLVDAGAGTASRAEFLQQYFQTAEEAGGRQE